MGMDRWTAGFRMGYRPLPDRRVAASRPKALAMVDRVAGILPAIRRRDAFDTARSWWPRHAIAKLRLALPPILTRTSVVVIRPKPTQAGSRHGTGAPSLSP